VQFGVCRCIVLLDELQILDPVDGRDEIKEALIRNAHFKSFHHFKQSLEKIDLSIEVGNLFSSPSTKSSSKSPAKNNESVATPKNVEKLKSQIIQKLEELERKDHFSTEKKSPWQETIRDYPFALESLGLLLTELKLMDSVTMDNTFEISVGNFPFNFPFVVLTFFFLGVYKDYLVYDENVIQALLLFPDDLHKSKPSVTDLSDNSFPSSSSVVTPAAPTASSSSSDRSSSLFTFLNRTLTSMGTRLLRQWLEHPLLSSQEILKRQNTVQFFIQNIAYSQKLRDDKQYLKGFPDLLKIILRIKSFATSASISTSVSPMKVSMTLLKDLLDIYKCMVRVVKISELLQEMDQNSQKYSHQNKSSSSAADQDHQQQTPPIFSFQSIFSDLSQEFSKYFQLIENLIDEEHMLAYSSSRRASSEGFHLHRDRFIRIKPTFTENLQFYYQEIKKYEDLIRQEYERIRTVLSLQEKEFNFEFHESYNWHFRITKRLSTKIFKILDEKKISYQIFSNQKAGSLFATKEVSEYLLCLIFMLFYFCFCFSFSS
jgi:hypothetical protein